MILNKLPLAFASPFRPRAPPHLRVPYRNEQDWIMITQRIWDELGFAEPISEDRALARATQFDYAALHGAVPGYSA